MTRYRCLRFFRNFAAWNLPTTTAGDGARTDSHRASPKTKASTTPAAGCNRATPK